MDFLSKVKTVKDNIESWQKEWGDDFNYIIGDFGTENEETGAVRVHINEGEHRDILKYLAHTGYIEVVEKKNPNSAHIKILPKKKPVIRLKTLELIAIDIGELDDGYSLVKFLKNCGVNSDLIIYPNTKWRMIYAIFEELAISKNPEDHKILFTIIEETCHPLMHNGNIEAANKIVERFNSLLKYDNAQIDTDTGSFIWVIKNDRFGGGYMLIDKNNDEYYEDGSIITPEEIAKLYVYWNELIKIIKFYLANKENCNDELNNIYFDIINAIKSIMLKDEVGKLKEIYNKPIQSVIGCEFELKKQGKTEEDLLINTQDFLGNITKYFTPSREQTEIVKKDNSELFNKIEQYIKTHQPVKIDSIINNNKDPMLFKIVEMPELKIKGLEEKMASQKSNEPDKRIATHTAKNEYKISVKDREIWINNYLLSKPHAVGSNFEFFEYVRSQPKNIKITKQNIPADTIKMRKSFTKILNELGFKSEISKAFFPQRGKSAVVYRGDEITKKDLEKSGVNIILFIKELELAHLKNSPK